VAANESAKFAAIEALYHTQRGAPITLGGIPVGGDRVAWAIEIPKMLSFLANSNFNSEIGGLNRVPLADRPPVLGTHLSFDTMVGSASALLLISLGWLWFALRKRELPRLMNVAIALSAPIVPRRVRATV
jgi:cytochrome d ubiquinol oxidase subunit I